MVPTVKDFFSTLVKTGKVKEALLGDNGEQISAEEVAEIMQLLPEFANKNVLELGCGAGRFTGLLADKAAQVTAVDFVPELITANKNQNAAKTNINYVESDVLDLNPEVERYQLAFSNVLLAFLADEECRTLMTTLLKSLEEGTHFFFREPCFNAGKRAHIKDDPTKYRDLAAYCALVQSCSVETDKGKFGFELVFAKSLQTYVKHEKTLNQICFMAKKVKLADDYHGYKTFMEFLDSQQYSRNGILRYEKIFGHHFVSTGGVETTRAILPMLDLKPGQKVLDIGAGIGGSAFMMVDDYDCGEVLAMDLSGNMISIGIERVNEERAGDTRVLFEVVDATKVEYKENEFDVIYSRDTILHIPDKHALFAQFLKWLKPGGKLLITDYCCSEGEHSEDFKKYVAQRGYALLSPAAYGKVLEDVGFVNVNAKDNTEMFLDVLAKEVAKTEKIKDEFIKEFSEKDYYYIVDGWKEKLVRASPSGNQRWGLFYAEKKL